MDIFSFASQPGPALHLMISTGDLSIRGIMESSPRLKIELRFLAKMNGLSSMGSSGRRRNRQQSASWMSTGQWMRFLLREKCLTRIRALTDS